MILHHLKTDCQIFWKRPFPVILIFATFLFFFLFFKCRGWPFLWAFECNCFPSWLTPIQWLMARRLISQERLWGFFPSVPHDLSYSALLNLCFSCFMNVSRHFHQPSAHILWMLLANFFLTSSGSLAQLRVPF